MKNLLQFLDKIYPMRKQAGPPIRRETVVSVADPETSERGGANKHDGHLFMSVGYTGWVRLIRTRLIRICHLIRSPNFLVVDICCLF